MGMTITEKIFAVHAARDSIKAGELVYANIDLVMGTDVTVPLAVEVFNRIGADSVFDPTKIALVNDHFVPAKDIQAAGLSKAMREFASTYRIKSYFEVGRSGICHCIVPDSGLVVPGDLVIGADSHTCTYGALGAFATGVGSTDMAASWALGENWFKVPPSIKIIYKGKLPEFVSGKDLILYTIGMLGVEGALYCSLEFTGEVIEQLPLADRFTICNMAIEAGAKGGIIEADGKVFEYLKGRTDRTYVCHKSDTNAEYVNVVEIDVSNLEPQIAFPYLPSNVKPISKVEPTKIDQVVIGSCTNGRIEDFRIAASFLKGREINRQVRVIIIPATQEIYLQMLKEGLLQAFVQAGATISPPTCGPCIGGHMGILAENEVGLYTTNRNFKGRNGHPTSKVYLCSPAVAAASAITG
ncbi:MAG: 3-isopropylmalate dehydratase large subunit, partial [Ignavibacteriae bacterium]|nr:3-isopropylmalate dehydratase large subunit [Ignavibacteriota bacterium]